MSRLVSVLSRYREAADRGRLYGVGSWDETVARGLLKEAELLVLASVHKRQRRTSGLFTRHARIVETTITVADGVDGIAELIVHITACDADVARGLATTLYDALVSGKNEYQERLRARRGWKTT